MVLISGDNNGWLIPDGAAEEDSAGASGDATGASGDAAGESISVSAGAFVGEIESAGASDDAAGEYVSNSAGEFAALVIGFITSCPGAGAGDGDSDSEGGAHLDSTGVEIVTKIETVKITMIQKVLFDSIFFPLVEKKMGFW